MQSREWHGDALMFGKKAHPHAYAHAHTNRQTKTDKETHSTHAHRAENGTVRLEKSTSTRLRACAHMHTHTLTFPFGRNLCRAENGTATRLCVEPIVSSGPSFTPRMMPRTATVSPVGTNSHMSPKIQGEKVASALRSCAYVCMIIISP